MSKERKLLEKVAVQLPVFDLKKASDLVDEIQELLAQPEQTKQEPVAWQFRTFHGEHTVCPGWDVWEHCTEQKFNNVSEHVTKGFYQVRKLYTAPPKREPLSDEEIHAYLSLMEPPFLWDEGFCSGIEWAEKQHGIGVDDE